MAIGHGKALGRVVAPPTGAVQVHLGPGMEITLVASGVAHLVAGDEARRDPDGPARLDEEHRHVPAGSPPQGERLPGRHGIPGRTHLLGHRGDPLAQLTQERGRPPGARREDVLGEGLDLGVARRDEVVREGPSVCLVVAHRHPEEVGVEHDVVERVRPQGVDREGRPQGQHRGDAEEPDLGERVALCVDHLGHALGLGVDGQVEGDEALEDVRAGAEANDERLEQHRAFVGVPGQVAHLEPHMLNPPRAWI